MMKIRVGLVGLGDAWESRHRPALRALGDRIEVRAVCEQVALRAAQVAGEFDATTVDGFRTLMAREDIDAILLLNSQWFGPLPILAACDAGKAVYCTTALGIEPPEARRIKQRVERSGIAFLAEFPRRQAPATVRLRELIETHLGEPRVLFCHHRTPPPDARRGAAPAGPTVRHDIVELIDWCRFVVGGDPTSVVSVAHRAVGGRTDDYQMMSVDFSLGGTAGSGPLAQISCGSYIPAQWEEAIAFRCPSAMQIRCERGLAFVDLPSTIVWFDQAGRHLESLPCERGVGEQLLCHFYRAVTSLVRDTTDLEDAYRALLIALAADQSRHEGRRVTLQF